MLSSHRFCSLPHIEVSFQMAPKDAAAIGVAKSANQKVGPVRVTHRSQASCPTDCPFRSSGCYAEQGLQGMVTRRLNRSTETDPIAIARENAAAIDRLPTGGGPLRIG